MEASSPEFWHCAYQLRGTGRGASSKGGGGGGAACAGCPAFMRGCAEGVLMAGKARILLRHLQVTANAGAPERRQRRRQPQPPVLHVVPVFLHMLRAARHHHMEADTC